MRFPDRERHQLYLEPEGLDVDEIYVNGLSMSLPRDVQEQIIHVLPGLEDASTFGRDMRLNTILFNRPNCGRRSKPNV